MSDIEQFKEGYHEFGEVRCSGCNERVEFDDCETLQEAQYKWNKHIMVDHE